MAVLTLDYRCCDRKRPLYIKHIEVERIAAAQAQGVLFGEAPVTVEQQGLCLG